MHIIRVLGAVSALFLLVQLYAASLSHAANAGALDISVIVAEKCRIDFSEGSADFFQVCSVAEGVNNQRASRVLGAANAIAPENDPYYLDRVTSDAAAAAPAAAGSQPAAPARRGPNVVVIQY